MNYAKNSLTQRLQTYASEHNIVLPQIKKKRIFVAVTSNRRFYGTVNEEVVAQLQKEILADEHCEVLVIGQTGKQIMERSNITVPVAYTSFMKDEPTAEEVHTIVTTVAMYTEVVVIHPTYVNAFEQTAKVTDVTHVPHIEDTPNEPVLEYLFEPDIPVMLDFFATQIRFVLFDRIMLTGARLMKMQRAREKAEEMLTGQRRVIHKEMSTMQSMRLLETFTGFHSKDTV